VLQRPIETTPFLRRYTVQVVRGRELSNFPGREAIPRRSEPSPALNPKLPQMMVQMLIHQHRPFHRSQ
jgi:hypothetical protein